MIMAKSIHPIATNHPDYKKGQRKWRRCRDACAGSDAIKGARTEYLPKLGSQKGLGAEERYSAYLNRALFYNASRRTKIGLSGAATVKPTKFDVKGERALEFAKQIDAKFRNILIEESLEVGRYAIVVNQTDTVPFARWWCAESIVNWRFSWIDNKKQLVMLVLEDEEETYTDENPYAATETCVRHSYVLRQAGGTGQFVVVYSKFQKDDKSETGWIEIEEPRILQALGGRDLPFIPAIIRGPLTADDEEGGDEVEDPLLLDLVDVNISHYQNSADLEHGRHWTALPTAVITGFPTRDAEGNEIELSVGSEVVLATETPGAQAFYLEFSGAGLGHLSQGMQDKKDMMAVLGARLLEQAKPSVEAAETLKTRMMGEKSILSRTAASASNAMTWTLRMMLWFVDLTYDMETATDTISLNTDFLDKSITTAQLQSLTSTLQQGGISYDTYFWLLQNAELIPPGRTQEEEESLIDAGRPGALTDPFTNPGGQPQ